MVRFVGRAIGAACVAGLLFTAQARAANIDGAWTSDLNDCQKIFVKKNNKISMTKNSDFYGSGFIINGKELRGRNAKCQVQERKDEGSTVNIVAACASDIAFSTNQFSLRIDGDNKITRMFPGMPDMNMAYFRCPM